MILGFLMYFYLSKIVLILLMLTINRYLYKHRLTKQNFFFNLLLINQAVFLTLFHQTPQYFMFFAFDNISNLIIFYFLKNFNLVGVTGTIGSGKSTILQRLEKNYKDFPIIDADKILHLLFKKHQFVSKVKQIFGSKDIYVDEERKAVDKKKIGQLIFLPENSALKRQYLFFVYKKMAWEIIK